jgi:HD-like signal output (HDOD) protein
VSDSLARAERVAAFMERIAEGQDFPALSDRVRDVMQVLSIEDVSMQHLANIILKDYSLTMKVLRTANSFHYNRVGTPIVSVTQAMVLLGMGNVRDLAGSLIVFEHYQGRSSSLKELMLLSMLTASHVHETAEHVGYARPEEAHLRGMFRNLGEVLVAGHAPAEYTAILARIEQTRERPADACLHVLGFRYDDLTEAVCRLWGIPPAAIHPREEQQWLDRLVTFGHDLTTAVYRRGGGESPATLAVLMQKHGSALGLTFDGLRTILERGITDTRDVFDNLGVTINDLKLRRQSETALRELFGDTAVIEQPERARVEAEPGRAAQERLIETIESMLASPVGFDLNQVLLAILECALRSGSFDHVVFCVVNTERTEAIGRFGLGADVESRVPRTRFRLSQARYAAPAGPALLRGTDLVIATGGTGGAGAAQLLLRFGVEVLALLPVTVEGKLVGALYADRIQGPAPDAATLAPLEKARALAARAMLHARGRGGTRAQSAPVSAPARCEAVLRLLRGEAIDVVSRDVGVSPDELDRWRTAFLNGALTALREP